LANVDKIEELLEDYPSIKIEDIYTCLDYAVSLAEEQIAPIYQREHRGYDTSIH
jgi:uncharacterized protein (DUF433 family)